MAYSFQIEAALELVRRFVIQSLSVQGESPRMVADAISLEEVADVTGGLPRTVLQAKSCRVQEEVNEALFSLPIVIHQIRETEPGAGSGAKTAARRLSGIGAGLMNDPRLAASGGSSLPVHNVTVQGLNFGDDNPVQQMLNMTDQDVSYAAASLSLHIQWYEQRLGSATD